MVVGKKFVLKRPFDGMPKTDDFELIEENLPPLKDGEILIEAMFLSVDPYMRMYVLKMSPPFTMIGIGVYKVAESQDSNYPKGATVIANVGWVKTGIYNTKAMKPMDRSSIRVPPAGEVDIRIVPNNFTLGLSESELLGACGSTGNTAYFGLLDICQPKSGETVVVNGAAGAVGSLVGQIAKLKGCHVIGFAGSDKKCDFLTKELGFDKAYNYKTTKVDDALKESAPKGVDCFFDNVGGVDATVVINNHMNVFGRISGCGAISVYNEKIPPMIPSIQGSMVFKQLKMEGFIVSRWANRWNEGITQMAQWVNEGKIKTQETIVEGFEKMPEAFLGLFTGNNVGKMIVKA